MSNVKTKKSVTQKIKDSLLNGKSLTDNYVVTKLGGSPNFLNKRVSEFRANGMPINTIKKNGVTSYKLQPAS